MTFASPFDRRANKLVMFNKPISVWEGITHQMSINDFIIELINQETLLCIQLIKSSPWTFPEFLCNQQPKIADLNSSRFRGELTRNVSFGPQFLPYQTVQRHRNNSAIKKHEQHHHVPDKLFSPGMSRFDLPLALYYIRCSSPAPAFEVFMHPQFLITRMMKFYIAVIDISVVASPAERVVNCIMSICMLNGYFSFGGTIAKRCCTYQFPFQRLNKDHLLIDNG